MKLHPLACGVAAAICATTFTTSDSLAQEAGAQETLIVTAQRREQDLQEVPISMVAITGETMEVRGIETVEGLSSTIPNLIIMGDSGGDGTTQTSFRVRGIPGVGTYVDGIWQVSTRGLLTQDFIDVERVEVLRGPQGTLFGRDSVGGAVRIVTKTPGEEFAAKFKGTIGSDNRTDASVSVDVPFSDNVLSKWTFASLSQDGYVDNITTGLAGGSSDQTIFRGDIVFTPTDRLDFRFNLQSNENSYLEPRVQHGVWWDIPGTLLFPTSSAPLYTAAGLPYTRETQMAGWPGGELGEFQTRTNHSIPNWAETDQVSITTNYDLNDNISIQFLTGFVEQDVRNYVDFDNSQYGLVEDLDRHKLDMWSQEIQISGSNGPFEWVAGFFYWEQETYEREMRYSMEEFQADGSLIGITDDPIAPPPPGSLRDIALNSDYCMTLDAMMIVGPPAANCDAGFQFFSGFAWTGLHDGIGGNLNREEQDGMAIFGEATVGLTDALDFTFGLRYHDQDILTDSMIPTGQAPLFTNQTYATDPYAGYSVGNTVPTSFDETTIRLSLQYQFTTDIMGYVSFSEGFNAGGSTFAVHPVDESLYLNSWIPETVENLEFGLRSDLNDGKLRFNATVFMMDWDDVQAEAVLRVDGVDFPGLYWQNIGTGEVTGAEFELSLLPTENIGVFVNLGLLDTKLTEASLGPEAGWIPGVFEFSMAPETTANLGFQHTAGLSNGGSFVTRFDYSYSDQYWRNFDPTLRTLFNNVPPPYNAETGDYGLLNARFTYIPQAENYEISVFGTNLTDEYVLNSGFMHSIWGFDFGTVAPGRQVGVSMTAFFD